MVVESAFLIVDKEIPVTKISCLEAHLSMKYDLEMYFTRIWGHLSIEKIAPIWFIVCSMLPSDVLAKESNFEHLLVIWYNVLYMYYTLESGG